jgi:Tfp pilus assembly protein PilF
LCNIGAARLVGREPDRAEALFRKALAADPKHPCANYNLASLLHKRQGLPAARPHYEAYLDRAPSHEASRVDEVRKLLETSP